LVMSGWHVMVVNLAEAKAHLSELVEAATNGKVVVIARRNVPLVRLQPVPASRSQPRFGLLRGKIDLSSDFDAPLEDFKPYRK
jgi:prevent-host-death family protein